MELKFAGTTMNDSMAIEVNGIIETAIYEHHQRVIESYWTIVDEFKSLLLADDRYVCFVPLSFGKDSKIVSLAALEAYRSLIAAGEIESARPLIMITVDTVAESLPMIMYPQYAAPRLIEYANQHSINLHHHFISPSFYDEYANRYLGAQKIIPNARMSGDCSVILKVSNSSRFIRNIRQFFQKSATLSDYVSSPIICATGQRLDEGVRRAGNMEKQQVSKKTIDDLKAELTVADSSLNLNMFNYAPIRDWTTDDVFLANELAGDRPLTRNLLGIANTIPSFLTDHALLLAIYGNAANEQCEVAIGSTAGQGCNAKSRYGCSICTMVGQKDNTQSSLATLERWNFLGQQELLRIRDYMYRLSIDTNGARALHAKAIDSVTYNRVALQNNILKPVYLEKLVRLFSQVSILSVERAAEIRAAVANGTIDEHPAIQCIQSDPTLNAKARRAFLEMYKERAQTPLVKLFSERHGAYLSFRWSLDGIQSLPYAPLAIWHEALTDRDSWIDWPETNEEYQAKHGALVLNDSNNDLKDAIMMPLLDAKYEDPQRYLNTPSLHCISNLWTRPLDAGDVVLDNSSNCTTADFPVHTTPMTIHARVHMERGDDGVPISACIGSFSLRPLTSIHLKSKELLRVMVNNRVANSIFEEHINQTEFPALIDSQFSEFLNELQDKLTKRIFLSEQEALEAIDYAIEQRFPRGSAVKIKAHLKYFETTRLNTSFKSLGRKVAPVRHFTQRRVRKTSGRLEKTTTRLNFYPLVLDCRLAQAHRDDVVLLKTNFETQERYLNPSSVDVHFNDKDVFSSKNLRITDEMIDNWADVGGMAKALESYYSLKAFLDVDIKTDTGSHRRGSLAKQFCGSSVAERMVNEGVIEIDERYMTVFRHFKMRTDILHSIGAFDVQSMSYEEIERMPWAVSMKQHRHDKACVLATLRKMRSAQRVYVRAQLVNSENNLASVSKAFGDAVLSTSCDYIHYSYADAFKSIFNTQPVSFSEKHKSALTWLKYYVKPMSDINELIKTLSSTEDCRQIGGSINGSVSLGAGVSRVFKDVRKQVRSALELWSPMVNGVAAIVEQYQLDIDALGITPLYQDRYDSFVAYHAATACFRGQEIDNLRATILQDYRRLITESHPHIGLSIFEPDCSHWKPNLCVLWSSIVRMLEVCQMVSQEVEKVLFSIEAMLGSIGVRQFQSGSLEQQLAFLATAQVLTSGYSVPPSSAALSLVAKRTSTTTTQRKKTKTSNIDHLSLLLGL